MLQTLGLKVNSEKVRKRLASGYNIISLQDQASPHQADFIIQEQGRLQRRKGSFLGLRAYYQTPESLILSKLRMIKATHPRERSLKDREDIRAIIENTKVTRRRILLAAKKESTLDILTSLLPARTRRQPRRPSSE